jgi:hypothetical protein
MRRPVRTQVSYPRRQQQVWARKATLYEVAGTALFVVRFVALGTGRAVFAAVAFPAGCALIIAYTSAANRAARHRIGADSERLVHDTLERLRPHGYTITHGARWRGGGDLDHLVRTPDRLGRASRRRHARSTRRTWSGCAAKPTPPRASSRAACSPSCASPASATSNCSRTGS